MSAFDIRCLTMDDAIELTGQKRPPTCAKCGGQTLERYVELTGRDACLHDFERLVRVCEDCGNLED